VFHVELRQFPHVARTFNLTREELQARVLGAWVRGELVEMEERSWAPERARLTIYEGPQLKLEEMGVGRGWANVTKNSTAVTDELLTLERQAAASASAGHLAAENVAELQAEILERCALGELTFSALIELLNRQRPGWRISERIALAEQSIWELLHRGAVALVQPGPDGHQRLDREAWQPVLLRWENWSSATAPELWVELAAPADQPVRR
jgi:hypothetical protein